ncbi:MAG TPA: hypothetical protein VEB42_02660, partial [Chitinophagaceae bacterium]|nr:hypothetical protein [Chitinophagaceae bacterium]
TREFSVLFDCNEECAQQLHAGDEWIIYSRYKQISNAKLDWCSRSRKYFRNDKEDFYLVNTGTEYFTELTFLREQLGQHRLLGEKTQQSGNRNKLPGTREMLIYLGASLAGILLFYFLFRRWR